MLDEYRMGVGIFLLNKEKNYGLEKELILKQIFGKCLKEELTINESPREAMIRELGEEVGIKKF